MVPVLVLFRKVEPFLWSEIVLAKMANQLGKPLGADANTTDQARLSFARVLVEIDVSQPLKEEIVMNTP